MIRLPIPYKVRLALWPGSMRRRRYRRALATMERTTTTSGHHHHLLDAPGRTVCGCKANGPLLPMFNGQVCGNCKRVLKFRYFWGKA